MYFYESMTKARRCSKDPKLISNHFKITNDIYPTGEKLYTWRLRTSDSCFICNEKDRIVHALAECNETTSFISLILDELVRNIIFIDSINIED